MEKDNYKTEGGQRSPCITMGCFVWEKQRKTNDQPWCVVFAFSTAGRLRSSCLIAFIPQCPELFMYFVTIVLVLQLLIICALHV